MNFSLVLYSLRCLRQNIDFFIPFHRQLWLLLWVKRSLAPSSEMDREKHEVFRVLHSLAQLCIEPRIHYGVIRTNRRHILQGLFRIFGRE
jgi:hypothetical protein